MKFPDPLIEATLRQRYKRFLSDHEMTDGSVITAHCANPGAMTGLKQAGAISWLSPARNPKRKLKYSWELVEADGGLVGINTAWPNALIEEAISQNQVPELSGYETMKREVKYGENSRIDILLSDDMRPDCYVEIKNVHLMRQPGLAEFPDSVTARGAKHLREMSAMVAAGKRAVMVYLVQRMDCRSLAIAGDIDPKYMAEFDAAMAAGVEAICYDCQIDVNGISVRGSLPVGGG